MTCMYEMLPPNDQPTAPKKPNKAVRDHQSGRGERSAAVMLASAPGIIAPYSWPKFPRMPHPTDREREVARMSQTAAARLWVAEITVSGIRLRSRPRHCKPSDP